MRIKGIKWDLLFIAVSILVYVLILWYLLKFVETPVKIAVLIPVFTPIFTVVAWRVNRMFNNLIKNMKKRNDNRISLRCRLDEIIKYSLNANDKRSLSCITNIQLINFRTFPPKIERKIAEYNEKAKDLTELSWGCEQFVKDMVAKNVLERLYDIDNRNVTFQWIHGVSTEKKLSKLLPELLTEKILSGSKIDKPLLDSVSPTFFKNIDDLNSSEKFALFLRDLNYEIKNQKKYGCLKLLAQVYNDTKKFAENLRDDAYLKK
jgi:hypothetical protein